MLVQTQVPGLVTSTISPFHEKFSDQHCAIFNTLFSPQELVEDEDDDFLKGEVPQSDTVTGLTPSSYDAHLRSPSSSVGSPPVLYTPDQSPPLKDL